MIVSESVTGLSKSGGLDGKRSNGQTRQRILIACWASVLIFSAMGPAMVGAIGDGQGTIGRQIAFSLTFLIAVIAIRPVRFPKRLLAIPASIVITLAWYWASISWALSPDVAFRRIALTTIVIWSIFLIVRNLGYTVCIKVMRWVMVGLLIANYIAVFQYPALGMHGKSVALDDGEVMTNLWRGVMAHKNFAGVACAITVLLFAFDRKNLPLWLSAAVIAASGVFLFFSGSKTSGGLCLFALLVGAAFVFLQGRWRTFVSISLLLAGSAGAIVGMIYKNPLSANFSDKDAFTGRPMIWKALYTYWDEHPWLGSGYGSFWNIGPNDPINHLASGWVTKVAAGHNGFLDLLAQTGVIGLALAVISAIIIPIYRLLSQNDPANTARSSMLAALLFFTISHNATETSLFDRDAIPQVFLMFTIAAIGLMRSRSGERSAESLNPSVQPSRSLFGLDDLAPPPQSVGGRSERRV